jgi:tetratricopeptide (TPR) repeat protein
VIVAAAAASPARGEEAAGGAEERARAAFEHGVALVAAEDFEGALQAFDQSLRLFPTPVARLNHALCLRSLGRNLDAFRDLERYLADHGGFDAERRAAVEGELEALRRELGRISVEVLRPAEARVLVDGDEVGTTPLAAPIDVEPGPHVVELRAPGFHPLTRGLRAEPGGTVLLSAALEPLATVSATPPPPSATPPRHEPDLDQLLRPPGEPARSFRRRRAFRSAAYALGAVGAGGLITTLGLYLWNDERWQDWTARDEWIHARGGSTQDLLAAIATNNELAGSIEVSEGASWAVFGVSLALVGTAAALLAVGLRRPRSARLALTPRYGWLGVPHVGATP